MLSLRLRGHRRERTGERGFTLVETLVVLLTGTVVISALFTIIDVTLRNTTRTFSQVDATQHARTLFETMENELHSACVAGGVIPIQAGANGTQVSDSNNLVFLSQEGAAAAITPVEHKITYSAGTLTETTYGSTGGTPPNWTFSATPQPARTLATNLAQQTKSGVAIPVFQYFKYDIPRNASGTAYTDSSGNSYMILLDGTNVVPGTNTIPANSPTRLATPLSASDAGLTTEVVITLSVGASVATGEVGSQLNTNLSAASDPVTDSVVFRVTPAPVVATSSGSFDPCQ